MKPFVLPLLCVLGVACLAPPPGVASAATTDASAERSSHAPATVWSVVGVWKCKHPEWTRKVTIAADGTFLLTENVAGTWKLVGDRDHVTLELHWYRWDSQTLVLVTPDELRGPVRGGEMVMQRDLPAPPPDVPGKTGAVAAPSPTPAPTPLPATSPELSPSGRWAWQHNSTVNVINLDGTVGANHDKGTWRWTDRDNRELEISWKHGFVDKLTVSEDGKTMRVTNNADEEFTVRRLAPPSASEETSD